MNTKWFSGIGLAILLGIGTFIYTTKTQARPAVANAAKPDATLENLTTCATTKNPAYLESVLKGALHAFDNDAKSALKAGKPAELKKASKNLLKVIKFLFVHSKHFSPIYKEAAHKAAFDKDIDKVIQILLKAEYALAKSNSAQKEVIKDYTAIAAELEKDGVEKLTPIAIPKETKSALDKLKGGLGTFSKAVKSRASKASKATKAAASKVGKKLKSSTHGQKALMAAGAAAISGGGTAAIAKAALQQDDDADAEPSDDDTEAESSNDDADDDSLEAAGRQNAEVFEPEDDEESEDAADDDSLEAAGPQGADAGDDDDANYLDADDESDDEEAPADEDEEATEEDVDDVDTGDVEITEDEE